MAPAINHTGYTGLPSLPLACLLHLIAFFYDGSVNDQCVEGDTEAAAGVKEKEKVYYIGGSWEVCRMGEIMLLYHFLAVSAKRGQHYAVHICCVTQQYINVI